MRLNRREIGALSCAVAATLASYIGPVAVMSFNPEVGRWFARNAPDVLRGLVVPRRAEAGAAQNRVVAMFTDRARPDFLAYDIRDLPSSFAGAQRMKGLPVLTWTCRSVADRARAAEHADQIIYEVPPR